MKSLSILVHLNSGGINGKSSLAVIQDYCNRANIKYNIYISKYPKHTKTLIKDLITKSIENKNHRVVVIGGDGTLNEAIYGLVNSKYNVPIAYFPSGTGNDFARSLNLTTDPEKFIEGIFKKKEEELELILAKNNITGENYVGLNGIGVGFDALISHLNNTQKGVIGKVSRLAYISKIMDAFKLAKKYKSIIKIDEKEYIFDNVLFISFMKNCYYGSGIKIDPYSSKNNGEIGVIIVKDVNKRNIPKIVFDVVVTNKHIEKTKQVKRLSAKKLNFVVEDKQYLQADGEVSILEKVNLDFELIKYPFYLIEK